jgi:hypothetical protein
MKSRVLCLKVCLRFGYIVKHMGVQNEKAYTFWNDRPYTGIWN